MTYYSHSRQSADGKMKGSKDLKVHIDGVTQKALSRIYRKVDLGFDTDQLSDIVTLLGKLHDLGKYTTYFQNYLLRQEPIDHTLKQHARIGGIAAYHLLKEKDHKLAIVVLYLIFLHHSGLISIEELANKLDSNTRKVFEHQKADITGALSQIADELDLKEISSALIYPDEKAIRKELKIWTRRNADIRDYFILNYLFSLLIEADKLDASDTVLYHFLNIDAESVDKRFGKPEYKTTQQELAALSNNELRNYCRAEVVKNIERDDILNQYLFTLTAPTGIGKTMTALDFSLKLKDKIREAENFNAHIIYALPFINIIEQSLKEYKDTLPESVKILGHYQYADVFGQEKDDDEKNYDQKLMTLDTWQADVVITSFVQFFETLIGNRNKLLKKFNHLAGAIIILDEVQTLRLDQMPLIGAALFYLTKFLKARIILMTATKPKIFELAQSEILDNENERVEPLELLHSHEVIFNTFHRTSIIPLLDHKFDQEDVCLDFIESVLSQKWSEDKSCLLVCNTVKRSIDLYYAVQDFLNESGYENPLYYLSTNIVPAHRFAGIQNIKQDLKNKLAPILIATQVVEAGVDLDFDMGFRDVGPVDSIIQVAGRINRNNNPQKKDSPLYIVDFKDAKRIYGVVTYQQSLKALHQQERFFEKDYLQLIDSYFDEISDKSSFSVYRKVFKSMKELRYDSPVKEDYPVSSFKIIEESISTYPVFIELGEEEANLCAKYLQKIKGEITKEEFDKSYKQQFQQRIITVPSYLSQELDFINEYEENIRLVPQELVDQFYDQNTGFVRSQKSVTFML
jgi:CRISPR-associated endonuclease/helicase Cas3